MLTEPRRQGSTTKSLGLTRASFSIQASQHSTLNTGYSTLNTGSLCLLWVVLLLVAWVLRGALREVVVFGAIPRMSPPLRPPPRHHRRRRRNTFAVTPASPPASPWLRHRHPPRRRTPLARDSCAVRATPCRHLCHEVRLVAVILLVPLTVPGNLATGGTVATIL